MSSANAHWTRTFRTHITEPPTQHTQCVGFHVCCCAFFAGKIWRKLNMHQLLMVLLTAENSEEELDDEKLEGLGEIYNGVDWFYKFESSVAGKMTGKKLP
jgi:hypothetical protein